MNFISSGSKILLMSTVVSNNHRGGNRIAFHSYNFMQDPNEAEPGVRMS